MPGKRKREVIPLRRANVEEPAETPTEHQKLFRRYFESRFEPLSEVNIRTPSLLDASESVDSDAEDSEWEGFPEDGNSLPKVEVVELSKPGNGLPESDDIERSELKSFMVSLCIVWQSFSLTKIAELQASSRIRGRHEEEPCPNAGRR